MTSWTLLQTEDFEKQFKKLIPKHLRTSIKSTIFKLADNPYVGKPLGYTFFREKKCEKWRIYYLIYEAKVIVYFVGLSDKKLQQEKIDELKTLFDVFAEEIDEKII